MERMLMDDCVLIRIEAIKKIPIHLNQHWDPFPRNLIKNYLKKIVDELSLDSVAEVRLAVYEGMGFLFPCPSALDANEKALRILARRGPNDKIEKVRFSAFKMLNKLRGHRYIKLTDLIKLEDLLLRLDFEHSNLVQEQIVRLIFDFFCHRQIGVIDYVERFNRIRYMCKISRTSSLHFHRLIYRLELISIKEAVTHIRSLLMGVKFSMKKRSEGSSDTSGDETEDVLNLTGFSAVSILNENPEEFEEKLRMSKDVLDSAIVLWLSIRHDIFEPKYAAKNAELTSIMANILHVLTPYLNTSLFDSTLVIARHLPKEKVGRLFTCVRNKLEKEEVNAFYFGHYIEAFLFWDPSKLVDIIERGLKKLRNAIVNANDRHHLTATPKRKLNRLPKRESPSPKKVKIAQDAEFRRPLQFIKILLSNPQTSELFQSELCVYLNSFFETLSTIRRVFGELVLLKNWEERFEPEILFAAYETLNIIILLTKQMERPRRNSQGEEIDVTDAERNLPLNDRLIYNEMKWFASILNQINPSFSLMEMFLRTINLHLDCNQLTAPVLSEVASMLIEIKNRIQDAYNAGRVEVMLKKSIRHLEQSLIYCDEQIASREIREQKVQQLIDYINADDQEEEL